MPTVTVHFGSWVQLPERLARSLGLNTGDRLSAELEGERIVLTRAGQTAGKDAELEASTAAPNVVAAPPEEAPRRARGRRKQQPDAAAR